MEILDIRIDTYSQNELKEKILEFLNNDGQHVIATPNPEILTLAYKNPEFKELLNRTDINIPDGVGLKFAAIFLGQKITQRITGVDLVEILAETAAKTQKSIFFLGGEEGISERAAQYFSKKYPTLKIFEHDGGIVKRLENGEWRTEINIIEEINSKKPDILLVALGHGKQEFWINDHLNLLQSVKIAVGIGGALDYFAGKVRRAPKFIRKIGLEWLWRLICQPARFSRIITAVIEFPWLVLTKGNRKQS